MPKVFVPQQPSKWDVSIGHWVPTMNLDPAKKHGDLVIMLPPEAGRLDVKVLAGLLAEKMAGFGPEDYIVAVGDPSLFAVAACIATRANSGVLRILKWDRVLGAYIPMEVTI